MATRVVEGKKPYTGGKAIEITDDKVINLRLREENNLIIYDSGDNEIYVDLQLPDEITPTDAFPVGVTTGRVIVDNGWDAAGTIICAKTTSGDNIKILYEDNGKLYIDNGTGTFKQIYLKGEVDALLQSLRNYVDTELAKKQDKLIAGENITIAADGKTISATTPPMSRFLSLWNCATGQPISFPADIPFEYMTGDHYMVEIISSATPAVNLRPNGTEYDGTASSTPETAKVAVGDVYIYDGTVWLLQKNTEPEVSFSAIAGQPTDNANLANALAAKQDVLTAGTGISISNNVINNTAITTVDSALSNSSTNPVQNKVITNSLDEKQDELTAGDNITIGEVQSYAAMQGPCDSGFHIPMKSEWDSVLTILNGLHIAGQPLLESLHIPKAGRRINYDGDLAEQSGYGYYWSSTANSGNNQKAYLFSYMGRASTSSLERAYGLSIRPFKDSFVVPTASWTIINGTLGGAGIFWNTTDGLISVTSDGSTGYTLSDKNLGATVVWSSGDTLSESNCGYYYQRGNNYGFPYTGSITTSKTRVDASDYGPGNYYSSSTFIRQTNAWDTSNNNNLWGGITGIVNMNVISASAPVTSVNGQTGDVTIDTSEASSITTTQPSNPVEGDVYYDTTNDQLKVYDGTNWNVTGKEYNAGEGIEIKNGPDYSAMQGPALTGYHIPSKDEWVVLCDILTTTFGLTSDNTTMETYLKLPSAGGRNPSANTVSQDSAGFYWSSTGYDTNGAYRLLFNSSSLNPQNIFYRAYGLSIRCFKDTPVVPDNNWTTLYDGSSIATGAGVYYNSTLGLISVSGDGTTWYTIQDKNLGATTVYNSGDTLSESNCGNYYQRGNNYGFPRTGSVTTSSTKVDASNYGPGNYYNSSTFITASTMPYNWDISDNGNLRGGVTGVVTLDNAITNTGVLSINGQTGNITIETFQLAPNSPLAPKYRRYGTQAQYDALTQYYTEVAGDTVYFTI